MRVAPRLDTGGWRLGSGLAVPPADPPKCTHTLYTPNNNNPCHRYNNSTTTTTCTTTTESNAIDDDGDDDDAVVAVNDPIIVIIAFPSSSLQQYQKTCSYKYQYSSKNTGIYLGWNQNEHNKRHREIMIIPKWCTIYIPSLLTILICTGIESCPTNMSIAFWFGSKCNIYIHMKGKDYKLSSETMCTFLLWRV